MNFLENSCYDLFDRRLADLEEWDGSDISSRISALENWKDSPVSNAGASIAADLSTGIVLGLLTAVAPAMNSTNGRVNQIAARVNALQAALVSKGLMAA